MRITLGRDENGNFTPAPPETLFANREQDYVETVTHGNEPLTTVTFLDAALEGIQRQSEG